MFVIFCLCVCAIVCDDHWYKDDKLFYRFRKDDGSYDEPADALILDRGQQFYSKLVDKCDHAIIVCVFHVVCVCHVVCVMWCVSCGVCVMWCVCHVVCHGVCHVVCVSCGVYVCVLLECYSGSDTI